MKGRGKEFLKGDFHPTKTLFLQGPHVNLPLLIPLLNNLLASLPLMQRIHLHIMERGIKGVRLINNHRKPLSLVLE